MLDILKKDNVASAVVVIVIIPTTPTTLTTPIIPTIIVIAAESFKTSDKWISSFMKRNKLA